MRKSKKNEDEEFQVENSQMFQLFKFPGILVPLDLFSRSQVHYEVQEFSRQKTLLAVGNNYFKQLSLIIAALYTLYVLKVGEEVFMDSQL